MTGGVTRSIWGGMTTAQIEACRRIIRMRAGRYWGCANARNWYIYRIPSTGNVRYMELRHRTPEGTLIKAYAISKNGRAARL